jgi:hypothetical protein
MIRHTRIRFPAMPGAAISSVQVEGAMRRTGFEARDRKHLPNVSGTCTGQPDVSSADELAIRLSDFERTKPKAFTGAGPASGKSILEPAE